MAIGSCLIDTNILLRMTRRSDPQHQIVDAALGDFSLGKIPSVAGLPEQTCETEPSQ